MIIVLLAALSAVREARVCRVRGAECIHAPGGDTPTQSKAEREMSWAPDDACYGFTVPLGGRTWDRCEEIGSGSDVNTTATRGSEEERGVGLSACERNVLQWRVEPSQTSPAPLLI